MAETQAVRAYLAANGRAPSLHAAGIALLSALPQEHQQRWTKDTAEQALALASALGSGWRPEGKPIKESSVHNYGQGPIRISVSCSLPPLNCFHCAPELISLEW